MGMTPEQKKVEVDRARDARPRVHGGDYTPATRERYQELKRKEAIRKEHDPDYLTREEAAAIPPEALDIDPSLAGRVERSSADWPENQLSASQALAGIPTDQGQPAEKVNRQVDTARVFGGDVKGALGQE